MARKRACSVRQHARRIAFADTSSTASSSSEEHSFTASEKPERWLQLLEQEEEFEEEFEEELGPSMASSSGDNFAGGTVHFARVVRARADSLAARILVAEQDAIEEEEEKKEVEKKEADEQKKKDAEEHTVKEEHPCLAIVAALKQQEEESERNFAASLEAADAKEAEEQKKRALQERSDDRASRGALVAEWSDTTDQENAIKETAAMMDQLKK